MVAGFWPSATTLPPKSGISAGQRVVAAPHDRVRPPLSEILSGMEHRTDQNPPRTEHLPRLYALILDDLEQRRAEPLRATGQVGRFDAAVPAWVVGLAHTGVFAPGVDVFDATLAGRRRWRLDGSLDTSAGSVVTDIDVLVDALVGRDAATVDVLLGQMPGEPPEGVDPTDWEIVEIAGQVRPKALPHSPKPSRQRRSRS